MNQNSKHDDLNESCKELAFQTSLLMHQYHTAIRRIYNATENPDVFHLSFSPEMDYANVISKLKDIDSTSPDQRFIFSFNLSMSLLTDPVYKEILCNDFLYPSEKKWWSKKLTRSVYYRKRKEAMKEFLEEVKRS